MAKLGDICEKIRSKNAGPFWLSVDIFCGTSQIYDRVVAVLATDGIARLFAADPAQMKRFDIASLNVIKFSLPRPEIQGSVRDRDMHGASWAALLQELEIE